MRLPLKDMRNGAVVVAETSIMQLQPSTRYTCFISGGFVDSSEAFLKACNASVTSTVVYAESDGTEAQAFEFVTPPSGLVALVYDNGGNETLIFEYAKIVP